MKLFIVALSILSASCMAQIQDVEERVVKSQILWDTAWQYHESLLGLQSQIDETIEESIVAVSKVLDESTDKTLRQYEELADDIEEKYQPALEIFKRLIPNDCRRTAETVLNMTTEFAGFDASICASHYDRAVRTKVSAAHAALAEFNGIYSQVGTIVVKAFSGENVFLHPDEIEDRIVEIHDLVKGRWDDSRPQIDAVRSLLKEDVASQNAELGNCHVKIMGDLDTEYARFSRMVNTCEEFNNTPAALSARTGRNTELYMQLFEEFKAEHAKLQPYEWKA